MVPAAEASHEGAAAETASHHADEEDETAMEGASPVQAPLPSQPTARELEAHRVARSLYRAGCEACVRWRGRHADHKGLAAEQDHVIGTASVGCAFFGEPDLTAKLVLILREHRCRVTEALLVKNKWVVNSVADMVRRAGPQRHIFKSDQQPSILDLKNQGSC